MFLHSCSPGAKILIVGFILALPAIADAHATTKWQKAPKPKFPKEALKAFVEGSVTIRAVIAPDGSVTRASVSKGSGDARLDNAAIEAALKWKMEPASIRPSDLEEGYPIVFDFAQEAMLGAVYSDRKAWFTGMKAGPWVFAPFPAYPKSARRRHEEGRVLLMAAIDGDGIVSQVKVAQSSGHPILDNAAVTAVRHWRAHKRYAGLRFRFPVNFTLSR